MAPSHILLLGPSGSGKTQFTNAVTGSNFTIGTKLTAQTLEVQSSKFVGNPDYVIIDTPGFDNDAEDISSDTVVQIPGELTQLVTGWCRARNRNSGQLRAIIYFHDLSRPRFNHCDLLNIKIMKKIVERTQVNANAIFVVTTKGDSDNITQSQKEQRERELDEKIKQHMGRELSITPCRRDKGHAIEVVQDIVDSLSLAMPTFSPSASTLVTNRTTNMPPPGPKGLPKRIWRGIVKVWRFFVPSHRQTGHLRK